MGQKVDPRWFRVGHMRPRPSEWFANTKKELADYTVEDLLVRKATDKFYPNSGIAKILFRKGKEKNEILIFTAKPALILWKGWVKIKSFKKSLNKEFWHDFEVVVKEIRTPETSARIMAEFACAQLEKRMPFRRVAKGIIEKTMQKWAIGIKILIGWRLNGADIARHESFIDWRVPLQTLRADIDYHYAPAVTKYGVLWVKVWIYKGDFGAKSEEFKPKKRRTPARKRF